MSKEKSYAQILKASSIMGGAAGITMLLGMVRVKFAAVFIGTAGVGLNASFTSIQTLIGTLAGLGLQSSAVRDIAAAVSKNDQQEIGRKVLTLRRICWLTGLIGMLTMLLLSPMLSQITFGHQNYAVDIAALGLIILFANLSGGQMALIQGMRRIGDVARSNVLAGVLATIAAIGFYAFLGLRGIVPALITASAFQLALSCYFARQVPVPKVLLSIRQTFSEANDMMRFGLVMMFSSLMVSTVNYAIVALITQQEGTEAVGLYSAAFALSGIFVNFVLGAMGTDYYPRLCGVVQNKESINKLVNEQTEIGLLLAVPGLMVTLALAPWILEILYSYEFLGADKLLNWFVLGCLGRVISWPIGFILMALGSKGWLLFSEFFFGVLHFGLVAVGLQEVGLEGVGIAYALLYVAHVGAMNVLGKRLTNFQWNPSCSKAILMSITAAIVSFMAARLLPSYFALPFCFCIAAVVALRSIKKVLNLLGARKNLNQKVVIFEGRTF